MADTENPTPAIADPLLTERDEPSNKRPRVEEDEEIDPEEMDPEPEEEEDDNDDDGEYKAPRTRGAKAAVSEL